MAFTTKKLPGIDLQNPNLGVTFILNDGSVDEYNPIVRFNETDISYEFTVLYDYVIAKNTVKEYRFHEIGKECWQCQKHCPLTDVVVGDGVHYKGTGKEFKRKRDFCSNECLNKYVADKDNDFTLL